MGALMLSVLDLAYVHDGSTSAAALASSMRLAEAADELGYRRYWFAEHHNMPSIASTSPAVLVGNAAARTTRIRLGSGGVMLPNHAPLIVAEQFATLEALAPGRIDLGLGRAPGSDPVVTYLLRDSGPTSDVSRFPEHVQTIQAMLQPDGATMELGNGRRYQVKATGAATSAPEIWLLGSSNYSAELAARLGLPYVFANHFSGFGLDEALRLYRSRYQPSAVYPEPVTFLTANVATAETRQEAEERALPHLRAFGRLRLNRPLRAVESVAELREEAADPQLEAAVAQVRQNWFIGAARDVSEQLHELAGANDVDEVMVVPQLAPLPGEPTGQPVGAVNALRLLAENLG